LQYATLALGSALALFLYPHSITAVLASKNRDVIKRNMSALPAYSLALGLLALLGFMAIAAGTTPVDGDNNTIVPALMDQMFPDWFAGVAFAAIGIGALVPAAIMSIAAANLFTRNIYKEYFRKDASSRDEARVAKIASLVVKLGALAVIIFIDPQFSIDLQLIGGVIILQTMPALAIGLFTRWFHPWALIAGWVGGMGVGMLMLYNIARIDPATGEVIRAHFGGSAFALTKLGFDTPTTIYTGFVAIGVNLLVAVIATFILRAMKQPEGTDTTRLEDYFADEDDPRVQDVQLDIAEPEPAGDAGGRPRDPNPGT
jgi:SSS family solute:Na+ symporter